ncbi:MAG TPA: glycerol-3-phosphate dehydrogenase/oxidase [Caulobacteraceae bacterium]|nr:glycerol-3-phosphate dehydrogenase/oxidase [Caulobacteraceae bacterium]
MAQGPGSLDLRGRDRLFEALAAQAFDVVVIGGGITGAGVARDAAMRGLSVALVEARDFGSGTSSRSSKMIHGGLRYLPMGDIALVREAASERKIVQAIAPHLARETPFVMPAKTGATIAKLRAGLWTFEKLGGVPKSRKHEVWSHAELEANEPAVRADGLAGAVVYPEYLTDDARLTLTNVRSAAASGATVANYCAVEAMLADNGRAVGVAVRDTLPGAGARTAHVTGRVLVNAAGPWVDAIRALEAPDAAGRLKLTKGVHLVVPRDALPVSRTVIFPAPDRRSIFAVPKGKTTYIGTTDTFHPATEDWPEITRADADYLLAGVAEWFRVRPLTRADIASAWSGVRPLVGEDGKSASDISRKDELWTGPAGVLSIAGGKLTAYRRMAERVVDQIEQTLGRKPARSRTAEQPLPGGDVDPAAAVRALVAAGADPDTAARRVGLYGSEADAAGDGAAAEATHAVLHEGALTLEDYWVRRSARAWFDLDPAFPALDAAAQAMAPLLGWTADEGRRQIDHCRGLRAEALAEIRAVAPVGAETA